MKKVLIAVNIIILLFVMQGFSQTAVTKKHNFFRHRDKIKRMQTDYIQPGVSGRHELWDFSKIPIDNNYINQSFYYPFDKDTVNSVMLEQETKYCYKLKNDTLFLVGFDNKTTHMEYQKPEAYMKYPFNYGDTLISTIEGKGIYSQKINIESDGISISIVDAMGKLITPEGDTLKNVFRIHQIKSLNEIGDDSLNMDLESYRWYARGFRYPIVESVKSTLYKKDNKKEYFATSFYYTEKERAELAEDIDNNLLLKETELTFEILSNCKSYPNPVINMLTIRYELAEDANISFRICDGMGKPWRSVPPQNLSAGMQHQEIDMGGFPRGEYCLYIMANDRSFLYKILKI